MKGKMIQSSSEIACLLHLDEKERLDIERVIKKYPVLIPYHYLKLIDPHRSDDPVKKMCVPSLKELDGIGEEDTSGEADNTMFSGLQHKYGPTVLLLATHTCLMYCRHCFRKRLVGLTDEQILDNCDVACAYIDQHKEVNNVLISGGDPLTMHMSVLDNILEKISNIDHLDFIRIGSRIPVVYPDYILEHPSLLNILSTYAGKKILYLVTHINHSQEISPETSACVKAFRDRDILVSNQGVLLRGVNDQVETIVALMRRLTKEQIIPYYLFQCRPVKGVKTDFQVPILEGVKLVEKAKHRLSGHDKRFRYVMSHVSGKIEIVGLAKDEKVVFKYHEARDDVDAGRVFTRHLKPDQSWLSEEEVQ